MLFEHRPRGAERGRNGDIQQGVNLRLPHAGVPNQLKKALASLPTTPCAAKGVLPLSATSSGEFPHNCRFFYGFPGIVGVRDARRPSAGAYIPHRERR